MPFVLKVSRNIIKIKNKIFENIMQRPDKVILNFLENRNNNLLINILKTPLIVFSLVFRLIVRLRRFLYENDIIFKAKDPLIFTISIGNINMGGSGKTPFAFSIAEYLYNSGLKPCIVSRGYGGKLKKKFILQAGSLIINQNFQMKPCF